jgi:hypothetical protein
MTPQNKGKRKHWRMKFIIWKHFYAVLVGISIFSIWTTIRKTNLYSRITQGLFPDDKTVGPGITNALLIKSMFFLITIVPLVSLCSTCQREKV